MEVWLAYPHGKNIWLLLIQPDLHPGIVVVCIPGVESWTVDDFLVIFGAPGKLAPDHIPSIPVPALSEHVPMYLVRRVNMSRPIISRCFNPLEIEIM